MKRLALVVTLIVLSAATSSVRAADELPALSVETILQGPEDLSWQSVEGNALIIEFWTTWCLPCVAAFPHWNELVEAFEGEPVKFLSISNEREAVVRPFLEERELKGWVALDPDESVREGFGVVGLPYTLMIDKTGKVQAHTFPDQVDEQAIRDLIAGRTPDVASQLEYSRRLQAALGTEDEPRPLFEAVIKPAETQGKGGAVAPGVRIFRGVTVKEMFTAAFGENTSRILVECELPEQRYDLVFSTTGNPEYLERVMRESILTTFGLEAEKEVRSLPVLVLTAGPEVTHKLKPVDQQDYSFARGVPGVMSGQADLEAFTSHLAAALGTIVLDETGLEGYWKYSLEWNKVKGLEALRPALRDQMGLVMTQEERQVEVLVVRDAGGGR